MSKPMNDITNEQKRDWILEALSIAGFTEKQEFLGIFTQELGMKQIVVDLTAGKTVWFLKNGTRTAEDDEHGTLANVMTIITDAEDGKMPTKSEPDEIVHNGRSNIPATVDNTSLEMRQSMPMTELSVDTIKKYINDKATDDEAYVFLQLCQARGLNPFLKEAHLIKYDHLKPATMVVGKDAFMKRAELHPCFAGIEAGIILESGDDSCPAINEREGSFYLPVELTHIVGGWAKVYRTDRKVPIVAKVAFSEYVGLTSQGQPNKIWGSKPATMIRKVAIVQALREAFTTELGGCYDQCEMGIEDVEE